MIRRIRVVYRLRGVDGDARETVERVHGMHADRCPVYRTLHGCIDISTELRLED